MSGLFIIIAMFGVVNWLLTTGELSVFRLLAIGVATWLTPFSAGIAGNLYKKP
jgi:hypothetical protein